MTEGCKESLCRREVEAQKPKSQTAEVQLMQLTDMLRKDKASR